MISLSYEMILNNTLFAWLLGTLSGFFHSMILRLYKFLCGFLSDRLAINNHTTLRLELLEHMYSFLFVIIVGMAYIISTYAFMDGAFHIYPLVALFLSFWLSIKVDSLISASENKKIRLKKLPR